jgi:hypothetical protein
MRDENLHFHENMKNVGSDSLLNCNDVLFSKRKPFAQKFYKNMVLVA